MNIHVLRHVAFEDEAYIGAWAREHGHTLAATNLYAGDPLPALNDFDLLVLMGGPMNSYEHEAYPWLVAEKEHIRSAIAAGKAVLGICLGGQLLADALGGVVTRNPDKEIGWLQVSLDPAARSQRLFAGFPSRFVAFHWHGDTFTLPPHCLRVASSQGCSNQAFAYKNKVVGLQFHLESTADSIGRLIDNCREELVDGPYIQSEADLRAGLDGVVETNRLMAVLLDNLAAACKK